MKKIYEKFRGIIEENSLTTNYDDMFDASREIFWK